MKTNACASQTWRTVFKSIAQFCRWLLWRVLTGCVLAALVLGAWAWRLQMQDAGVDFQTKRTELLAGLAAQREQAVRECLRVLRRGGLFVLSYINRNATFINKFGRNFAPLNELLQLMKDGKNDMFYVSPTEEVRALPQTYDLETVVNIATDGLMYPLQGQINALDAEQFALYLEYHFSTCEAQMLIGHSMHGLWFGRKRG